MSMVKLKKAAAIAVQCQRPSEGGYLVPLLVSPPGEGKTSFTKALAGRFGWEWIRFILARHERSDFILPVPTQTDGEGYIYSFALVKQLADIAKSDKTYLIFLDEITRAPATVISAMLTFVQERELGGVIFNNVRFIVACNPPLQILDPAFLNRCVVINWEVDVGDFERGLLTGNWGDDELPLIDPNEYQNTLEISKTLVVGFLNRFPQHFKGGQPITPGQPFPSLRAWESVACALAGWLASRSEDDVLQILVEGLVGKGIAEEFLTWYNSLNVPSWGDIHPPSAFRKLPIDIQYLVVCQIAKFISTNELDEQHITKIDNLFNHMTPDMVGLTLHMAINFSQNKQATYIKIKNAFRKRLEMLIKLEDTLKGGSK